MATRVRFRSTIEPFKPGASGGLMIALVPEDQVAAIGGLKQLRVSGTVNGTLFTSNTMPRAPRRLALSVSKAMMAVAGLAAGDEIEVEMAPVESDG